MNAYPKMTGQKITAYIKSVIDDRLDEGITDSEASQKIQEVLSTRENRLKICKAGKYTSTFLTGMGLQRMEIFNRLYHR